MAKGRKKLPDALKLIKGTARPHRGRTCDSQDEAPMSVPATLSEAAVVHFEALRDRVAVLGLDSSTYTEALALAAMRMAEIDEANEHIKAHGAVIETANITGGTLLRANPAVTMRNEAMRHLQSLLAEFGLSPSSIGRVGARKKEPEKKQGFGGL